MARMVAVVPHTHWDREWYDPFPAFRMRLVDVLDEFLPTLESQPEYRRFLLDGQMAALDDYLAVRPDAAPLVRRLAGAGRLALGPWYVLMDEFGVSGETIVRNLQLGQERAAAFGGAMPVGYLPDMFGHVAQMPQLLRQAGMEHAVVWRGVPGAITRTGFWWRAPDGSTVRAEYLPTGYGNGAHLPPEPSALVRRVRAQEAQVDAFLACEADPLLLMNGTDHQAPHPWLPQLLEGANAAQDDFHFEIQSLVEYLASAPTEALPSWSGELRSSARANLLMGVLSNRVDVKIAAARAERALERRAEPLAALWFPAECWPATLLDGAWLEVIRNSAHDSICACSADSVVDAV
ncbi:MAG: glycoside hydrolase family 38 N-terminal domain-containing protein, partial [Acidimicrobiales bacterium]